MGSFRNAEAAKRFAERRQQEDDAPRLKVAVPSLEGLRLEIESRTSGSPAADSNYVRHIVVDRAPALFLIPCADSSCRDGGHDVSREIMRALEAGQQRFEGEDRCYGSVGMAQCRQVLNYVGLATYRQGDAR